MSSDYADFRERILAHLSWYKTHVLGIEEHGIFHYKGREIPEPHILPKDRERLNILECCRDSFFSSSLSNIPLHMYFHHLNSSQALCINLFYPLISEKALGLIADYAGIRHCEILAGEFEVQSDKERAARKTSFDFVFRYNEAEKVLFEVKYTEDGFGKASSSDVDYEKKYHDVYLPLLQASEFLVEDCKTMDFFLENYQLLRNLVHITSDTQVVLLFTRANPLVLRKAQVAHAEYLTDEGRERSSLVFLEELIPHLRQNAPSEALHKHFAEFERKYLPSEAATLQSR